LLKELCTSRNFPLFEVKKKSGKKKKKLGNYKSARNLINEIAVVEQDRKKLNDFLTLKENERISRHLRRSSGLKRGCFKISGVKNEKRSKSLKVKLSQPKYKRYCQKKLLQKRIIYTKEIFASKSKPATKKKDGKKRSKSTPSEPKLYSFEKVKIRISAKIQNVLDALRGAKNVKLVKFSDVDQQFGEMIDRIKQLKFSLAT